MKLNTLKKIFSILIIVLVIFTIVFFSTIELSAKKTDGIIDDFISRGAFYKKEGSTVYYKVSKAYDYEDTNNIIREDNFKNVGTTGDIYITATNFSTLLITKYICKRLRCGHSGLVYSPDATSLYEIVGNKSKEENVVKEYENDWDELTSFNETIILRVKNINAEDKERIKEHLEKISGYKYNAFVLMHAKARYYCTDLVTRCYEDALSIDIGKGIISTGATMIENDNTYLIYYKREVNKEDTRYEVYFLGD